MALPSRSTAASVASAVSPLLFFFFVVAGCAYITAAKFFVLSPFLVTSIPVAMMLVYAALVKFAPMVRLREDQAGDNLYYLGFLYTLTSLGVSLYQFRADGPAEEIVQNFGVAVGSTIAGVALRVLFNQMRRDPAEVEHVARLELAESARKMRRELDATVVELAHFRRSAQQQVSEGFEHVRSGMEEVSGRILSTFEAMTERAAQPFHTTSESTSAALGAMAKNIAEKLESAAANLAAENEKLASGAGRIATVLETTSTRLAEMQTPDRVIEVQFQPIASSLEKAMQGFAEQIARKDAIDREVIETIVRAGEQHRRQSSSLAALTKTLEKRNEAMEEMGHRTMAMSERMTAVFEELKEGLATLSSLAQRQGTSDEVRLPQTVDQTGGPSGSDIDPHQAAAIKQPQPLATVPGS